jgi:hypothetical protein
MRMPGRANGQPMREAMAASARTLRVQEDGFG